MEQKRRHGSKESPDARDSVEIAVSDGSGSEGEMCKIIWVVRDLTLANFGDRRASCILFIFKSFESRIKFYNGNIEIEQFLINLGKLGAADILGRIDNDKDSTNFKYESNIFVDDKKKFLSKFGIYNKENLSSNLFVQGNFNLENIRASFYEISDEEQFNTEDINFIESEFNDFMLENGFEDLFNFQKLFQKNKLWLAQIVVLVLLLVSVRLMKKFVMKN